MCIYIYIYIFFLKKNHVIFTFAPRIFVSLIGASKRARIKLKIIDNPLNI